MDDRGVLNEEAVADLRARCPTLLDRTERFADTAFERKQGGKAGEAPGDLVRAVAPPGRSEGPVERLLAGCKFPSPKCAEAQGGIGPHHHPRFTVRFRSLPHHMGGLRPLRPSRRPVP